MNKRVLIGAASLGLVLASSGVALANSELVLDRGGEKVSICRPTGSENHPYNAIQVSKFAAKELLKTGSFLYLGPTDEGGNPTKFGGLWCKLHVPTPSPSPSASPSSSPSPSPSESPEATPIATPTVNNTLITQNVTFEPSTLPAVGGTGVNR